jgi:hypothetical protein
MWFSRIVLRNLEGNGLAFYNFSSMHGGKMNATARSCAPVIEI